MTPVPRRATHGWSPRPAKQPDPRNDATRSDNARPPDQAAQPRDARGDAGRQDSRASDGPSRAPAGRERAPEPTSHSTCPLCGSALFGVHCKLRCPTCGYLEDCSDLFAP
jgi:hypothetical protein